MRYIKLLINLLILSFIFIVFSQNYEILKFGIQLQIGFFFKPPYFFSPIPLYMLLLLFFFIGVLFTFFFTIKERITTKKELRKCNRIIKDQEEELVSLRLLPLHTKDINCTNNTNDSNDSNDTTTEIERV